MTNRAKCKLCESVIASVALNDIITCSCGEISMSRDASGLKGHAKNYVNFILLDDNEMDRPEDIEKDKASEDQQEVGQNPMTKNEALTLLRDNVKQDLARLEITGDRQVTTYELTYYVSLILAVLEDS